MLFIVYEGGGKLNEFNRLPFGITNTEPVFQRFIDNSVDRNKLQKGVALR